ncbi:MAG TPA: thioredoxin domain-containing protein [Acidimicrobiales bacterium]
MNRLAEETSPYLRQHRDNPVDWYPWGDEAFELARKLDRPVLLSVGYSSCHWCHVMAHESFEHAAVADVMNELFVNIKVDREERPDVDAIYMEAVQAVTGQGGWPMTVFLAPDGRPFFGGTYFPRSAFVELLTRVAEVWRERRSDIEGDASNLAEAIRRGARVGVQSGGGPSTDRPLSPSLLEGGYEALRSAFDPEWGGFGRAPKFPQPSMVELLLRAFAHGASPDTLGMVTTTLDAMASGGIYDHVGGGFARYATDRAWLVPHFEKMLYDNAQLVLLYLHAWQLTGLERYRQVVEETIGYLLRPPMRLPGGAIHSAEDADSEGVEGKFYVWEHEEATRVGGDEAVAWYGVAPAGNWEGHNILWRPVRGDLIRPFEVEEGRRRLFEAREQRVRPGLDDKVVTEWNAMAIGALATAGAALARPDWIEVAVEIAGFLDAVLRRPSDGRWLRSALGGQAGRHLAYAIDYAWLVEAFTRLSEATGQAGWVNRAVETADEMLRLFWDSDSGEGGLFTTGHDAEQLIVRSKDTYDGATPSANSVAAVSLLRLAALSGLDRFREAGLAILALVEPMMARQPLGFTNFLAGVDLVVNGTTEIAVTGERRDLVATVQGRYLPNAVLAWGEPYDSPLWDGRTDAATAGKAFVCRDYTCLAPVDDVNALVERLAGAGRS